MRLLWSWYLLWTAADVATTLYLHRMYPNGELNALINALALAVGFDAATVIAAAFTTVLIWAMIRASWLTAIVAKVVMATRPVAALNNALIIAIGFGLVDVVVLTFGLSVYQAYLVVMLATITPAVIYFYKKAPPPPSQFFNFFRRRNSQK